MSPELQANADAEDALRSSQIHIECVLSAHQIFVLSILRHDVTSSSASYPGQFGTTATGRNDIATAAAAAILLYAAAAAAVGIAIGWRTGTTATVGVRIVVVVATRSARTIGATRTGTALLLVLLDDIVQAHLDFVGHFEFGDVRVFRWRRVEWWQVMCCCCCD